ncbi:MAG: ABC transporter ATP-binding protein, partial [Hyphomicrobiaceae bacterium]
SVPKEVTSSPALFVQELRKTFGDFVALDGVSVSVPQGQIRAVIGPNGAGKTTLINVLTGQHVADSGVVEIAGRRIRRQYPDQVAKFGVGRTYQISNTFRRMTVFDNMLCAHNAVSGHWFSLAPTRLREMHETVMEDLATIRLDGIADQVVDDISHGDRKRLEFGMVLATQPKILLLDEPTAGMALQERHELIDLMLEEARKREMSLLFIEHDIDVVFKAAEYITVMALGKVLAEGTPDEIANNKEVQDVYLGSGHG